MEELIREQLKQITQLEDKLLLKDLLNGLFMALYEKNNDMYQQLEERVFDEIEYQGSSYSIYTGLVKRQEYDTSHHFLFPIYEEDTKERKYDLNEILEFMVQGEAYFVNKVFIQCDYLMFQEILLDKQPFQGSIITDRKSYTAWFRMELNTEYWEEVYRMYKNFIKNGIPWNTINIPYISRMANVFLDNVEEAIPEKEEIIEIKIDFGEYAPYVFFDRVPVWNIKRLAIESTGFPLPCEDHVNYEHKITTREYGIQNGFLVDTGEEEEEEWKYIRHNKESLIIVAPRKGSKNWNIFMVVRKTDKKLDRYDYPLMSNVKTVSYTEKLSAQKQGIIKTKAELIRFIKSFELGEYLEFKDIKILKREEDVREETYSMNFFIIDEIRDSDYGKRLVLYFQAKDRSFFLIRDLLSFLVSEVQLIYEEYHCEGKLV